MIFVFLKIKSGQYIQMCLMSLPAVLFAVHAKSLGLEAQNTRRHEDQTYLEVNQSSLPSRRCHSAAQLRLNPGVNVKFLLRKKQSSLYVVSILMMVNQCRINNSKRDNFVVIVISFLLPRATWLRLTKLSEPYYGFLSSIGDKCKAY